MSWKDRFVSLVGRCDFINEPAVLIKAYNPLVVSVGYEQPPLSIHKNTVRVAEFVQLPVPLKTVYDPDHVETQVCVNDAVVACVNDVDGIVHDDNILG